MVRGGSPAAKTERLLNLVLVLLWTSRPLSKQQIRELVPQYGSAGSTEAFERMFERDKDDLRELGIPLVTEDIDVLWEADPGYRIPRGEYALPEIEFTPGELTVLGLAARTWAQASLAGPAAQGLRKLRASGLAGEEESQLGVEPRLRTAEPAFEPVKDAVMRRTPIAFDYARGDGERRRRSVEPWGLASWRGRWYLTGWDRDREAERVFRLSRILGPVDPIGAPGSVVVPAGHDAAAAISRIAAEDGPAVGTARIRLRAGRGLALRQRGQARPDRPGWDVLEIPYAAAEDLVGEILWFGPDAVVLDPEPLRDQVRAALDEILRLHGGVA